MEDNFREIESAWRASEQVKEQEVITIPADVEYIDIDAFNECMNLRSITCFATKPPKFVGFFRALSLRRGIYLPDVPIYVPNQVIELYMNDAWWGKKNILSIPS